MKTLAHEARAGYRTIWGSISGAGAVTNPGSADWIVTRTSAGVYLIRFTPIFRSPPGISIANVTWSVLPVVSPGNNKDSVEVQGYVGSTQTDMGFSFVVEGRM